MKKYQVYFKEINYGWVEIEVPDNATEDEICEKAWDKATEEDINWGKTNCDITDWEEI